MPTKEEVELVEEALHRRQKGAARYLSTACSVWLVRWLGFPGEKEATYYAKVVDLPFPPFIGLGISVDKGCDPSPIESVHINQLGAIVCILVGDDYSDEKLDEEDSRSQLEFHTVGWQKVAYHDVYRLPIPAEKET